MTELDSLSSLLLEQEKRFLELSKEAEDDQAKCANLHAALLIGYCALEAHVNGVADDLKARAGLRILDQSILPERDFTLDKGAFGLTGRLKMYLLQMAGIGEHRSLVSRIRIP